ncbi:MAG: FkbM family methyltransferase [Lysobacterales bacterium]
MLNLAHKIRRARYHCEELPASVAIREILWEFAHKMLRSGAVVSYSQFAETHIAKGFLDINKIGYYVDVGCNHPMWNSNTYEFYLRGWRGLAIDANPACTRTFAKWRTRDTVVSAAISHDVRTAHLNIEASTLMSSISDAFTSAMVPSSRVVSKLEIQAQRLDEIMRANGVPARFDLLSIDVEGVDEDALKSFSLEEYRPAVILIEVHGIDLLRPAEHPVVGYLISNGYEFVSLCRFTGVFVDRRNFTDQPASV